MIRLSLASLLLLFSLPGLFNIERLWWWKATLAVTEYGHRLAVLPLLMLLLFRGAPCMKRTIADILLLLTLAVLLVPLSSAILKARQLPSQLRTAYPELVAKDSPVLSLTHLFLGRAPAAVKEELITIPRAESPLKVLYFRAVKTQRAPCIIVLHSGGWERGEPEEFAEWNHYWAQQGYAVASVDYRLAPEWQWPAQRTDVVDALDYLKSNADLLGIDPTKFVLLGRSAGGQIATACAYSFNDSAIRGCVSLYAPADMNFAWKYARTDDILDSPRLMKNYLGGSPDQAPDNYLSASATLFAEKGPPALIVHGRRDTLVWHLQSSRLAARLSRAGIPHYLLDIPWATHALDYPFHGPSAELTRFAMDRFLRSVTR